MDGEKEGVMDVEGGIDGRSWHDGEGCGREDDNIDLCEQYFSCSLKCFRIYACSATGKVYKYQNNQK